ncbi:MAG: 2-hydroxyacyl-CoA dehydratase family protein, partial [Planctomycetota bacterium]|nr:2-hydroxyacyl-CoA dehydratase family protein [Planctomycetota bacterium]
LLAALRDLAFTASPCPMPALEMQIAEMLALHFCSDLHECRLVLWDLLAETRARVRAGLGVLPPEAVPVFWVNPVADLQAMNLLEQCGGRIGGTDYMFGHALAQIPEDVEPLEALAMTALADPMAGSAADRAGAIARQIRRYRPRAVVVSRIPGASHCATEGRIIAGALRGQFDIPVIEVEVPPLSDSLRPSLTTRLQAVIETAREAATT